jgi:hypothetical protein
VESLICLDGAIYMNTDESRVKHRGRKEIADLFLPPTPGRLVFLGVAMFLASGFAPYPYRQFVGLAGCAVLIGAVVDRFWPARRDRQRFWVLRACGKALWSLFWVGGAVFWGCATFLTAIVFFTWTLASLVTNGSQGSYKAFVDNFTTNQFEPVLLLAIIWILVGVPQRLSKINLDVQSILLGLITAAASVVTGAYILLLHFGGGPLGKINLGPLIIGTILTVVLVAPAYKSLARGCWRNGISKIFKSLSRQWDEELTELKKSLNQAAESRRAASNESGPEVRNTIFWP